MRNKTRETSGLLSVEGANFRQEGQYQCCRNGTEAGYGAQDLALALQGFIAGDKACNLRIKLSKLPLDQRQACFDLAFQNRVDLHMAAVSQARAFIDQRCTCHLQVSERKLLLRDWHVRHQVLGETHPSQDACVDSISLGLRSTSFGEVNTHLADQGITLCSGTLVDATIIDAPSSTKNEARARDPEMSSTKKGNDWFFGMKTHVGVDAQSGIVHSLETTTAKTHDSQVWDDLLYGKETSVWADKGYVSATREVAFSGPDKFWGVMRKAPKGSELHPIDEDMNRIIAKMRARV
jgi:hypothetical protein